MKARWGVKLIIAVNTLLNDEMLATNYQIVNTKFMDRLFQKIRWKKLTFLLIILSLVILFFIAFSFMRSSVPPAYVDNTTPAPGSDSMSALISPTISQSLWRRYSAGTFEVSYPSDFTVDSGKRVGSIESLVLHPSDIGADINIQSYSSQSTSVSKISIIFSALGYNKSEIIVGGISGSSFTGSFLAESSTVREKAVIIESNGKLYKMQLTYALDTQNIELEEIFDGIVSSFRLL